jgi:integrase
MWGAAKASHWYLLNGILKTLAGHRSIQTTAAYLYSSPSQLKAAVELIG